METLPTAQPRKLWSNPASGALEVPQQARNAASSGPRGDSAQAGEPIDKHRPRVGQRRMQWLDARNGASHRDPNTQRIASPGRLPAERIPHIARALRGAHLPKTAATAQAALRPEPPEAKPRSVGRDLRREEPQGETQSMAPSIEKCSNATRAIVSTGPFTGRETGCTASRSLRAVHHWQRWCAKRPDNVPPRKRPGVREDTGGSASYKAVEGLG